MFKNTIPWTVGVRHIKRHTGVITDIAVLAHVAPNAFNCLPRKFFGGHANGKSGARWTIFGMIVTTKDPFTADTAFFMVYGRHRKCHHHNTYDTLRLALIRLTGSVGKMQKILPPRSIC